jgi:hypothetical protein
MYKYPQEYDEKKICSRRYSYKSGGFRDVLRGPSEKDSRMVSKDFRLFAGRRME